jgi:hypothetical protein
MIGSSYPVMQRPLDYNVENRMRALQSSRAWFQCPYDTDYDGLGSIGMLCKQRLPLGIEPQQGRNALFLLASPQSSSDYSEIVAVHPRLRYMPYGP